jgi:hypothetical protein
MVSYGSAVRPSFLALWCQMSVVPTAAGPSGRKAPNASQSIANMSITDSRRRRILGLTGRKPWQLAAGFVWPRPRSNVGGPWPSGAIPVLGRDNSEAQHDATSQKVHLYSGRVEFSYPQPVSPLPDIR